MTSPFTFTTLPPLEKKRAFWTAIFGGPPSPEDEVWLNDTPSLTVDEIFEYCEQSDIPIQIAYRGGGYSADILGTNIVDCFDFDPEDALAMALFKLKGIEAV